MHLFKRIFNKSVLDSNLTSKYLEDYTIEERRKMWPPAAELQERHIQNCKLVVNREKLLELLPKNSICAEVGILRCEFSEKIMATTKPKELHLIDIEISATNIAINKFTNQIKQNTVVVHNSDSVDALMSFDDNYFDWIYIDGDHSYFGAMRDLEATRLKVKYEGFIVLNDYVFFGVSDFSKYGVVEAVNDFCIKYDWEMIFFALQGRMYNDVVLKKI